MNSINNKITTAASKDDVLVEIISKFKKAKKSHIQAWLVFELSFGMQLKRER